MTKTYKKITQERDVLTAARERFALLYKRFDRVAVSFSGGKDSTVCLNLAIEAAQDAGKLPVQVFLFDEEAIPPETVEYCERVRNRPEVEFKWICAPIKHRNACSRESPYWICWNPHEEELWCRPLPDNVLTTYPGFFFGATIPEVAHRVYPPTGGTLAMVRGIRAAESLRRYRSVAKRRDENWINAPLENYAYQVSPIYDWTVQDVWTAPHELGWDWNRAYDVMALAGIAPNSQRACPPYGEEPLGGLWSYAVCWPDLWHKMVNRVPGAAAAGRYCRDELYGLGVQLPRGMTWRQYTFSQLELYPDPYKQVIAGNVATLLADHKAKTKRPLQEEDADEVSGLSWKFLAVLVNRGDLKNRRRDMSTTGSLLYRDKETLYEMLDEKDTDTRY